MLLVGGSGLVGRHVLAAALSDSRVAQVAAPSRRPLPHGGHAKLIAPVVDFENLPLEPDWWRADAVICTLGTTMRAAGSREAFRRVDHDYPLEVARRAFTAGTRAYVLSSAIGANRKSRFFYNRVKGELEDALIRIGFDSVTFVRPGLIGGRRDEFRLGERMMAAALTLAGPVLPRRWRINPAPRIAEALLEAALQPQPGVHEVNADQMA